MKSRGFTLVELISIMIIVGIMAAVALPRFSALQGFDAIGYKDAVKATLEFARKSAVAQRRNVQVTIASGTVTVAIASGSPEGGTASTFNRSLILPGGSTNIITAPNGVTLSPVATITFDPLGRPSAGGSFTISNALPAIILEAETGYVH